MGWPSQADLQQFLYASGLVATPATSEQSVLDLSGALSAAIRQWNRLTGYTPFLSTGSTSEERRLSPRMSRYIDLRGGLLTLTSLTTGVTYSSPTGTVRTSIRDFRLMPDDAPQKLEPWTYIECIQFSQGSESFDAGSIKVVGEWGYATSANLPEDARRAVLMLATEQLMPQLAMQISKGGLKRLRQGDSEKEWQTIADRMGVWGKTARQSAANYRRRTVA